MKVTSLALDPIEKKPLARFHSGSKIFSVGSLGCTMHCPWCQNHEIAQPADPASIAYREMGPSELADAAEQLAGQGNIGLAYTYNEPLLHWEEVRDCAAEIHARGMLNVVVTNGLLAEDKLCALLEHIDALNIDLKGFEQGVYDICGGTLDMVKRTIEISCERSHVEVTTLLIPGLNDNLELLEAQAAWLAGLERPCALHLTRFFPRFRYRDRAATPIETMYAAEKVAKKHLDDVFLGNI